MEDQIVTAEIMQDDEPKTIIFPAVETTTTDGEQVEEEVVREEESGEEGLPLMVKLMGGHWTEPLTDRQKKLIDNCRAYAGGSPAGLPGHNLMMIISTLADTLDRGFSIADAISGDLQSKFLENKLFEQRLTTVEAERLEDIRRLAELEGTNAKLEKLLAKSAEKIVELHDELDGAHERNQGADL